MKSEDINRILNISESYELPDKLLDLLKDERRSIEIMDSFMSLGESLDHDWFTEYFEEQHANKTKMAQDFTPKEVCDLATHMIGKVTRVADLCAGTGGLTIGVWNQNKETKFVCYELSGRAIPLLLLNLAIRNIIADVIQQDILSGEIFKKYRVEPGEKYGRIVESEREPESVDAVISNPSYSMKYKIKNDPRFPEFQGILPSNFADYIFVAFGLSLVRNNGKLVFILSHGILFRGNKEREFRKYLIEKKYIRTVIGLPDKLFINTDIQTLILEINTAGNGDGVFIIDAKEACQKNRSKNVIDEESYQKILDTYEQRNDVERFASFVTYYKIWQNDFNML